MGGVASIDEKSALIGRPVRVGERLLSITDPDHSMIEIMVPVTDAISLKAGTRVKLFLNIEPHSPIEGEIYYASYRAEMVPEGHLAFRVKAKFTEDVSQFRQGLRGVAKVYGTSRPLIFQMLRRPFATLRQWLGV
ncbi:MAG: HlyD family secretion protein, partial [Sphingomonadales bacterium]|nr:HlyD family secretion protein [Sphingomonadales bacterium]